MAYFHLPLSPSGAKLIGSQEIKNVPLRFFFPPPSSPFFPARTETCPREGSPSADPA